LYTDILLNLYLKIEQIFTCNVLPAAILTHTPENSKNKQTNQKLICISMQNYLLCNMNFY
jgi:hypothetical protein